MDQTLNAFIQIMVHCFCPKYTNTESIVVNGENIVFHSSFTVWHKGTLAEWTFADTLIWT